MEVDGNGEVGIWRERPRSEKSEYTHMTCILHDEAERVYFIFIYSLLACDLTLARS